jgi:hypothetical protein
VHKALIMRSIIGMNPGAKSHPLLLAALILGFLAVRAAATTYYVDINSTNPTPPYTTWSTASTDIQSAVNQTTNGDDVLVNPGVYQSGGQVAPDGSTNAVVVTNAVTVQSVNGAAVTSIDGSNTMRCVYLTDGVSLIGFTLTNGSVPYPGAGGGAYCTSTNAMLGNCTLINNSAGNNGGGALSGSLFNCTIVGNTVGYYFGSGGGLSCSFASDCDIEQNKGGGWGGGAAACQLSHCTLANNSVQSENGGGADSSTLEGCIVTANHAYVAGGGANSCTLDNCVVSSNGGGNGAGGVANCLLTNCTVAEDSSYGGTGGAEGSTLNNCILYDNGSAYGGANFDNNCVINYSCTMPLPTNGVGNITNAPLFVNEAGGDFHLQPGSPCINAGNNSSTVSTVDLDGNARIAIGTVDMGAYEYQSLTPFVLIQSDYTNTVPGIALNFSGTIVHGVFSETSWDFGDGTVVSNQPTVSHSWARAGNFPVVFSASGPYGTGSATVLVHVEPAPIGPAQTNLFSGSKANITLSPGFYEITAYGAHGAYGGSGQYGAISFGGPGAEMSAEFYFSVPTTLTLLVGGGGLAGVGYPGSGGGGGGSFVVDGSLPLVIAGGGGGGGTNPGNSVGTGNPGLSITTGGTSDGGNGGTNGSGGGNGGEGGGGGGGYDGSGANGLGFGPTGGGGGPNTSGGASFIGGGTGGIGVGPGDGTGGGNGGFGGGGGGGYIGGGGGGGYSGGGAGTYLGGGGGGSYVDSSAIAILNETSGAGDGSVNGEIIITAVSPPSFHSTINAAFKPNSARRANGHL